MAQKITLVLLFLVFTSIGIAAAQYGWALGVALVLIEFQVMLALSGVGRMFTAGSGDPLPPHPLGGASPK